MDDDKHHEANSNISSKLHLSEYSHLKQTYFFKEDVLRAEYSNFVH